MNEEVYPKWLNRSKAHQYVSVSDNTFMKHYVQAGKIRLIQQNTAHDMIVMK